MCVGRWQCTGPLTFPRLSPTSARLLHSLSFLDQIHEGQAGVSMAILQMAKQRHRKWEWLEVT